MILARLFFLVALAFAGLVRASAPYPSSTSVTAPAIYVPRGAMVTVSAHVTVTPDDGFGLVISRGDDLGTMTFTLDGVAVPGCTAVAVNTSWNASCSLRTRRGIGDVPIVAIYSGGTLARRNSGTGTLKVSGQHASRMNMDGGPFPDILWTVAGSGTGLSLMAPSGYPFQERYLIPSGTGWSAVLVGDFNGDGSADIVFEHADGRVAIWFMAGIAQIGGAQILGAGTGWKAKLAADFDGDGKDDLIWEHSDGRVALLTMDGVTVTGSAVLLPAGTGWHAKLTGDFNDDGRADILWERSPDGASALWLMNGTQQIGGRRLFDGGTGWTAVALGDDNIDGKADIYWKHSSGGGAVWLMDGSTQVGGYRLTSLTPLDTPLGTVDFMGDGRSGTVWKRYDGTTYVRTAVGQFLDLGFQGSPTWTYLRSADFTGDLRQDLLMRNTQTGEVVFLEMLPGYAFPHTVTSQFSGSVPLVAPE